MRNYIPYLVALFVTCSPLSAISQNIIEDGGIGISEPELQQMRKWLRIMVANLTNALDESIPKAVKV